MTDKSIHVTPRPDGTWQAKQPGNSRSSITGNTQAEVIAGARDIARNQGLELNIHGRDNKIREKDSYGNDPCPPRG